jgi:branched-subunit amino acid ABC-type transport system permease component
LTYRLFSRYYGAPVAPRPRSESFKLLGTRGSRRETPVYPDRGRIRPRALRGAAQPAPVAGRYSSGGTVLVSQIIPAIGFGLVTSSIIALGAVGFTIQYSVSRIFNVAFGAVMTLSAYCAYLVNVHLGVNIWISLVPAALAGAVMSAAIYHGVYARFLARGTSVFTIIMVSLSVSVIVENIIQGLAGPGFLTYQVATQHPFHIGSIVWTPSQVGIMAVAVACMFAIHALLRYTLLGKAMRATAAEPDLAKSCGINCERVRFAGWAISGGLAGIAGVVLAVNNAVLVPTTGADVLLVVVAAAVVGGVGQAYGAMLGALAVGIVSELAAIVTPDLNYVAVFVLMGVILIVRPDGLWSVGALRREAAEL